MAWGDYFTETTEAEGTSRAPSPRFVQADLLAEGTDLPPMVAAPPSGLYDRLPRVRVVEPRNLQIAELLESSRPMFDFGFSAGTGETVPSPLLSFDASGKLAPYRPSKNDALMSENARLPPSSRGEVPGAAGVPTRVPTRRMPTFAELMAGLPMRTGGGSSSTQTTNPVIEPKDALMLRGRMDIAAEKEKVAVGERSKFEQARLRDVAAEQRKQGATQEAAYKRMLADQQAVDAEVAEQMRKNVDLLEEIKTSKIDPDRMYRGEGGGLTKMMHTIGIALGSFGATLGKGSNLALDIVNKAIDRDVNAQVANLANKRAALEGGRNLVADLYRKTGSIEKAYLMAKMHAADQAKTAIEAIGSEYGAQMEPSNKEILLAKLDQQQIEREVALKRLEYRRVVKTRTSSGGGLSPLATMAGQAVIAGRLAGAGVVQVSKADEKKNDTTPQADVTKGLAAIATLKRLDKLESMINAAGKSGVSRLPISKEARDFQTEVAPTLDHYVLAITGQAASDALIKKYESRFPRGTDPSGVGIFGERNKWEQLNKIGALRRELQAKLSLLAPGSTALRDALKREKMTVK